MQRLVFLLVYPFLWLISILPFRLFYLLSDLVFLITFYVVGYRRKTVKENLRLVFPEKQEKEIGIITRRFYRHMVDMFLEMIKSITIPDAELKKRFVPTNLEEIHKIRAMDKSILLACGHYASYEWMNVLQLYDVDYRGFGIYKKINNRYFDQLARDIRGRYDGVLIRSSRAVETIAQNEKKGIRGIYAMVADQSPRLGKKRTWGNFMGIRVPVFMGVEKLGKDLDMAVVYLHVEKVKRGHYRATFKPLSYEPSGEPEYAITKRYFQELEAQIRAKPEFYLWTHKRWKHRNTPIPKGSPVIKD